MEIAIKKHEDLTCSCSPCSPPSQTPVPHARSRYPHPAPHRHLERETIRYVTTTAAPTLPTLPFPRKEEKNIMKLLLFLCPTPGSVPLSPSFSLFQHHTGAHGIHRKRDGRGNLVKKVQYEICLTQTGKGRGRATRTTSLHALVRIACYLSVHSLPSSYCRIVE
jgi:hypothetical protein